jgi:spore maturation protein SpmA
MVLNYIWAGFFIISFIIATIQLFLGNSAIFNAIINSLFEMSKTAFEIALGLTGMMCLWLGLMRIAEKAELISKLSRLIAPVFSKIFPEIPAGHPASGSILMNFAANFLGLDNAATPLGLKAMKELQEINPAKDTASNSQIMFLVLNTSSLTIIPSSIIAYQVQYKATNPTDIFLPILIATSISSLFALIYVSLKQKINLFQPSLLIFVFSMLSVLAFIISYFLTLDSASLQTQSLIFANSIIFSLITFFIIYALYKKCNVYSEFVEGAKEGFTVAIDIIPYLVAILSAIAVFRASGALDIVISLFRWIFENLYIPTDFVDALPTAFMKPLSGSGSRGLMLETWTNFGVDSFVSKLSAVIQGSTETTFYVLAVYFGSVKIKHTRYAVSAGLFADFIGISAAIIISYLFFGDLL